MHLTLIDQIFVGFYLVTALVFFYQGWKNIFKKQLTSFSLDALLLWYLRKTRGSETAAEAETNLSQDANRMRTLGIVAFCGALLAIYLALNLSSR
jgi:hypothetical protein